MKLLVFLIHRPLKIAFKILQIIDLLNLMNTFCEIFGPHAQCNLAGVVDAQIKTLNLLQTYFPDLI